MAAEDVTAATGFWRQIPAEHRAMAAQGIMGTWAQTDPGAAADWVRNMPSGPDQQQALSTLLLASMSSMNVTDYGQLLNLVDSSENRDTFANTRIGWLVRNGRSEQAEAELDRLDLSPEGYRRARQVIDRGIPGP
jgi:hypothetical protein